MAMALKTSVLIVDANTVVSKESSSCLCVCLIPSNGVIAFMYLVFQEASRSFEKQVETS